MTDHPITPPPELFAEWLAKAKRLHPGESTGFIAGEVARLAYQTGADQELEACIEWLEQNQGRWEIPMALREARRPKPPSLKEQALAELAEWENVMDIASDSPIRRALEQLDD
jgi:hypothetical protein